MGEDGASLPAGTIHVVDPHPLNWLFLTWNTTEQPVRPGAGRVPVRPRRPTLGRSLT